MQDHLDFGSCGKRSPADGLAVRVQKSESIKEMRNGAKLLKPFCMSKKIL